MLETLWRVEITRLSRDEVRDLMMRMMMMMVRMVRMMRMVKIVMVVVMMVMTGVCQGDEDCSDSEIQELQAEYNKCAVQMEYQFEERKDDSEDITDDEVEKAEENIADSGVRRSSLMGEIMREIGEKARGNGQEGQIMDSGKKT